MAAVGPADTSSGLSGSRPTPNASTRPTGASSIWFTSNAASVGVTVDVEFLILYLLDDDGLIRHIKGAVWVPAAD